MAEKEQSLARLKVIDREIVHVTHIIAALDWDQQTYMPASSGNARADQLALLEAVAHNRNTSPEIGELLGALDAADEHPEGTDNDLNRQDLAFIREVYRRYTKLVKLPESLVTAFARERSLAQSVWVRAREADNFSEFAPNLEKLIQLCREIAGC